jgi:hypothetical protein
MRKNVGYKRLLSTCLLIFLLIYPLAAPAESNESVIAVGFATGDAPKGVPVGWELDRRTGRATLYLERNGESYCLKMVSDQSSFGIKRAVRLNIKEYPYLNWTWKASKLPPGGDVRKSETDDQAAQIYLAFPAAGFPAKLNTPVLGYVWDNEAPKEWTGRSPQLGGSKMRYVVVRNKSDKIGHWYVEKRNIYNDYQKLFRDLQGGEPTGPTQGISLYINSQHTKSAAECYIGDIFFSRQ